MEASFVGGSVARGGADAFSDVDLRVFLAEEPLPPPRFEMRSGAPLEWKFLLWEQFQDADRAFQRPFFPEEMASAVPLYDPQGKLQPLIQAAQEYAHRLDPRARAQTLLNAAYQQTEEAAENGAPLWNRRCALFWSCQAAAILLGAPPAHRRLLENLRNADAEMYEHALAALGAQTWERADALEAAETALAAVMSIPPGRADGMPYLSPARVPLWRGYFHRLTLPAYGGVDPRSASLAVWTIAAQLSLMDARLPETRRLRRAAVQHFDGADIPQTERQQTERLRPWLETIQRRTLLR